MNYRATVSIGSGPVLAYSVTDQDDAGYGLADPLVIRRRTEDQDLWPAHPQPATADIRIVAAHPADVTGVAVKAAPVSVNYYSPRDALEPVFTFDGLVTSVEFDAHDLGCLVTVHAADHLQRLADLTVGHTPYPGLDDNHPLGVIWAAFAEARDHLAPDLAPFRNAYGDMTGEFGDWPDNTFLPYPEWNNYINIHGLGEGESANLLTLAIGALADHPQGFTSQDIPTEHIGQYHLEPRMSGDGVAAPRTVLSYDTRPVLASVRGPLPLVLVEGPNGWTTAYAAPNAADLADPTIDGRHVERNAAWRVIRGEVPNVILVQGETRDGVAWTETVANGEDAPPVVATVESDLTFGPGSISKWRGILHLPLAGVAPPWGVESLTWLYHQEPPGRRVPDLNDLVTVARMRETWSPTATTHYPGLVKGLEFTLAAGEVEVDLELRPMAHRPYGPDAITIDQLPGTIDGLDPGLSLDDLGLVRRNTP